MLYMEPLVASTFRTTLSECISDKFLVSVFDNGFRQLVNNTFEKNV